MNKCGHPAYQLPYSCTSHHAPCSHICTGFLSPCFQLIVSEHCAAPVPRRQDLWKHVPTLCSPCPTQAGSLKACPNTAQSLSHTGAGSLIACPNTVQSLSHAGRISQSMSQHCAVPVPHRQDLSKYVQTLCSPCPTQGQSFSKPLLFTSPQGFTQCPSPCHTTNALSLSNIHHCTKPPTPPDQPPHNHTDPYYTRHTIQSYRSLLHYTHNHTPSTHPYSSQPHYTPHPPTTTHNHTPPPTTESYTSPPHYTLNHTPPTHETNHIPPTTLHTQSHFTPYSTCTQSQLPPLSRHSLFPLKLLKITVTVL